jgi:hypothetical protein
MPTTSLTGTPSILFFSLFFFFLMVWRYLGAPAVFDGA